MMHDTKRLLQLLTERIPPATPARHNITLNDGTLQIALFPESINRVYPFLLEESDFDRPVEQLADEICQLMDEQL